MSDFEWDRHEKREKPRAGAWKYAEYLSKLLPNQFAGIRIALGVDTSLLPGQASQMECAIAIVRLYEERLNLLKHELQKEYGAPYKDDIASLPESIEVIKLHESIFNTQSLILPEEGKKYADRIASLLRSHLAKLEFFLGTDTSIIPENASQAERAKALVISVILQGKVHELKDVLQEILGNGWSQEDEALSENIEMVMPKEPKETTQFHELSENERLYVDFIRRLLPSQIPAIGFATEFHKEFNISRAEYAVALVKHAKQTGQSSSLKRNIVRALNTYAGTRAAALPELL